MNNRSGLKSNLTSIEFSSDGYHQPQVPGPGADNPQLKPSQMFIGKENSDSEQKEINYLENEIQPILCEIMPYLLEKKAVDPVPLMI